MLFYVISYRFFFNLFKIDFLNTDYLIEYQEIIKFSIKFMILGPNYSSNKDITNNINIFPRFKLQI